jgi:hypothetical protein
MSFQTYRGLPGGSRYILPFAGSGKTTGIVVDDDDDGSFANLQVGRSTNTKDWFYFRTTLMIG